MHPDLPRLIDYARLKGLDVRISTNGVAPRLRSVALAHATSDPHVHWRISLDSHVEADNERLRGSGAYAAALKNLYYLKNRGSEVSIKCVLHSRNIDHLECLLELANSYRCSFTYTILFDVGFAKRLSLKSDINEYDVTQRLIKILKVRPHFVKLLNPTPFGFMLRSLYVVDALCVPRFTIYLDHSGRVCLMDSMTDMDLSIGDEYLDLDNALSIQSRYGLNGVRCAKCFAQGVCYVENADSWELPLLPEHQEFSSCRAKRSSFFLLMQDPSLGQQFARAMLQQN